MPLSQLRYFIPLILVLLAGRQLAANAQASTPLIEAAKKGDLVRAKAALKAGADVNAPGDAGLTPLMWASLCGRKAVVEALLVGGARINEADSEKGTALGYAIVAQQADVATVLQARGGTFSLEGFERFTWVMSRRTDIFDYIGQRTTVAKARADSAIKLNWAAPLAAPGDFRGSWTIDLSASQYPPSQEPKSVSYVITQTARDIVADAAVDGTRLVARYPLDGTDAETAMGKDGMTIAQGRWEGSSLILTTSFKQGQDERASFREIWVLSADGRTLTIDRQMTKPSETKLRLVLSKQ